MQNPTQATVVSYWPGQCLSLKPLVFKNSPVWNLQENYIELNSNIEVDTLLQVWGAESRADTLVKGMVHIFHLNPKCSRTLTLDILQDIFIESTPNIKLKFDTLLWNSGAEFHPGTQVSKRTGKYIWLRPKVGTPPQFPSLYLTPSCFCLFRIE
jgi:hypothetical protein